MKHKILNKKIKIKIIYLDVSSFKASKKYSGLAWWLRWLRICLQCGIPRFDPWVGQILWRRKWQPTQVFLPRKSYGQRSLVGPSPWPPKESDTTEHLTYVVW